MIRQKLFESFADPRASGVALRARTWPASLPAVMVIGQRS
jgi:hypothetical protein